MSEINLQHLKPKGKDGFRYRTEPLPDGKAVEVEIHYSKGGANYFTGGQDPRGIYASVTPITLKDGCVSFIMFSGKCFLVERLAAYKPSALRARVALLDAHAPAIADVALVDLEAGFSQLKATFAQEVGNA